MLGRWGEAAELRWDLEKVRQKSDSYFKSKFSRTGTFRAANAQLPSVPDTQREPTAGQRDRRPGEIRRAPQRHSNRSVLLMRCEAEVRGLDRIRASCFIEITHSFPHARTPCLNPTWLLFHFGELVALWGTWANFGPLSGTFCN